MPPERRRMGPRTRARAGASGCAVGIARRICAIRRRQPGHDFQARGTTTRSITTIRSADYSPRLDCARSKDGRIRRRRPSIERRSRSSATRSRATSSGRGSHRPAGRAGSWTTRTDHHRRRLRRDHRAPPRAAFADDLPADARHPGSEDGHSRQQCAGSFDSVGAQRASPDRSARASGNPPVSDGLQEQLAEPRTLATLAGALAGIALALAVVGLYGVTAFVVGQRSQEISVRVALGARGRDIMRLLLGDSLRPVMFGLAGGVFAALLGSRVFARTLYGVGSADPIAFGAAVLVLLTAAVTAVIVPTRRAAAVDPASVLRQL